MPLFLDGDVLSAVTGTIVFSNRDLLSAGVPAGIPKDGVDFGLDAVTTPRSDKDLVMFSTEIPYKDKGLTDGHVLLIKNGIIVKNYDLILMFEPKARDLGLDALSWIGDVPPEPTDATVYWRVY